MLASCMSSSKRESSFARKPDQRWIVSADMRLPFEGSELAATVGTDAFGSFGAPPEIRTRERERGEALEERLDIGME